MGWGSSRRSGTGQGTRPKVRDGSGDPWGGQRRVGGPYGCSGTRWVTLPEVGDGSGTLGEVLDGSGDPRGGHRRIGGPSGRLVTGRGPTGKFGTG